MLQNKLILYVIAIVSMPSFLSSCFSQNGVVETLLKNQNKYQSGKTRSLKVIQKDELRNAKDDKEGTLYYGGLLMFFNNQEEDAEIAFRRSARTGKDPWATESARLVVYLMTLDARYNQVAPFLESVFEEEKIKQDPELFYYYSFALFFTRDYTKLFNLVEGEKPQWDKTLRQRITKTQASFFFDFCKVILERFYNQDSKELYAEIEGAEEDVLEVLGNYRARDISGDITNLLTRVYGSIESIPPTVQEVLMAKQALRQEDGRAFELYSVLSDNTLFLNKGTIYDVLTLLEKNTRRAPEIFTRFENIEVKTNFLQKTLITLAKARYFYRKEQYNSSYREYKQTLQEGAEDILSQRDYNIAQWRMLFSVIRVDYNTFLDNFDVVVKESKTPRFFSNLLEEYLSLLLRRKQYNIINRDFEHFKNTYTNPYILTELHRWESILVRLREDKTQELLEDFVRSTEYYSDIPFDYLMNNDDINKEDFINTWKSDVEINVREETKSKSLVGQFVEGYLNFGLYSYAKEIIEENLTNIDINTLQNVIHLFSTLETKQNKEFSIDAFFLVRRGATYFANLPQTEEDFYTLYPRGFKSLVEGLSKDNRKRAVVFALVREESGFDPQVESHARAIGLMQLLQSTADDIASRIDYKTQYSLKDASDNLELGYNYYNYLVRVVETPINALVAYNGGLGNLWKWEKEYITNDPVVFADSLPFRETRNYVRKVISSAMIYALLYYDISPKEMKEYFTQKQ